MAAAPVFAPMHDDDVEAVAAALDDERVYRHIGGLPRRAEVATGLRRALAGPPAGRGTEAWLNYVVRLGRGGPVAGRLEATVHDAVAEVAFLLAPQCWGRGLGTRALQWLHEQLRRRDDVQAFWGTTVPANTASAALMVGCGYRPVGYRGTPALYSFDDGDLVFTRPVAD